MIERTAETDTTAGTPPDTTKAATDRPAELGAEDEPAALGGLGRRRARLVVAALAVLITLGVVVDRSSAVLENPNDRVPERTGAGAG